MTKNKLTYLFVIAVYFLNTVAVLAQDEFPEDDEGPEGPPPAPINAYLLFLAIIGIAFAWHTFKSVRAANAEQSNA